MEAVAAPQTEEVKRSDGGAAGELAKGTAVTAVGRIGTILIAAVTSVYLTRVLGPQGKGLYTVASLLPSLVVAFTNLGLGQAASYFIARGNHRAQEVFGNTTLLMAVVSAIACLIGLGVAWFGHGRFFPGVPVNYLLVSLLLIPLSNGFTLGQSVLLGFRRLKEYNLASLIQGLAFLAFAVGALSVLRLGALGALLASAVSSLAATWIVIAWALRASRGVSLRLNREYVKESATYGFQTHVGNILWMLNYRVDVLLVNGFLGPVAVGFYSLGVSLVEKLWLVSQAASLALFPWVAAEKDERRRADITPFVARTVLVITGLGALCVFVLSRWLVVTFFSAEFLPAVRPLQILLPGIITLGIGRILANDLAGRGRVVLNNWAGLVTATTNIGLNLWWIPRYGIQGAALASTVSYTASLLLELLFYWRVSGNSPVKVLVPRRTDFDAWFRAARITAGWLKQKVSPANPAA